MNSTQGGALRQLETLTRDFRDKLARTHRGKWVGASRELRELQNRWTPIVVVDPSTGEVLEEPNTGELSEPMADAISMARWHRGRDNGQKYRFKKLASCGTRMRIASCGICSAEGRPVPEGCGIARLCEKCSLLASKRRRARFGRARARVSLELRRLGYTTHRAKKRGVAGGRWGDKMITLTLPHFLLAHCDEDAEFLTLDGKAKTRATDATIARIYALRAAWPLFARLLRDFFKKAGIKVPLATGRYAPPPMHRAFEWTPGDDGLGHPHLHIWTIAPRVEGAIIQDLWRSALHAVGVPIARDGYVRVEIRSFHDFNGAAVGELLKGGSRKALEWSRLTRKRADASAGLGKKSGVFGPKNAYEYASGWTIADALANARPDVVASLYIALEGMRLTQGSAGFFVDDEPAACPCCSVAGEWKIRFETFSLADALVAFGQAIRMRGPP